MRFFQPILVLLFPLVLVSAGCSRGQQGRATTPIATEEFDARATATVAPSPTPTAHVATEEPTPEPPDPVMEWVTYRDEQAGLALDYPAFWFLLEPGTEVEGGEEPYSVTFTPWEPDPAGSEEIPEDAARAVLTVFPSAPPTLAEAAARRKETLAQGSPPARIIEQERWMLSNALPALYWQVSAGDERAHVLLTLINGRTVILRGEGEEAQFQEIARTLRPLSPPRAVPE